MQATGERMWKSDFQKGIFSSLALEGGSLLLGCHDGRAHCLDADTGGERWETTGGAFFSEKCEIDPIACGCQFKLLEK